MGMYPIILRKIAERRRKQPVPGQLFSFSTDEQSYWFGRVIRTDVPMMGGHVTLVYLYAARSPSPDQVPELDLNSMLGPPLLLGARAFRQGYLLLGEVRPLAPADILPQHVFVNPFWKKYIDVATNEFVPDPGFRCGTYGSGSFGCVNAAMCEHLGIAMQPWSTWKLTN